MERGDKRKTDRLKFSTRTQLIQLEIIVLHNTPLYTYGWFLTNMAAEKRSTKGCVRVYPTENVVDISC